MKATRPNRAIANGMPRPSDQSINVFDWVLSLNCESWRLAAFRDINGWLTRNLFCCRLSGCLSRCHGRCWTQKISLVTATVEGFGFEREREKPDLVTFEIELEAIQGLWTFAFFFGCEASVRQVESLLVVFYFEHESWALFGTDFFVLIQLDKVSRAAFRNKKDLKCNCTRWTFEPDTYSPLSSRSLIDTFISNQNIGIQCFWFIENGLTSTM